MPRRRTASRSQASGPASEQGSPRETWRQLLAAVDEAFHSCERYWHRGRYYLRKRRTFAALVRDPGNERIEVHVAASDEGHAAVDDALWAAHPEGRPAPRLHTVHVRRSEDIRLALRAVRLAERAWGRRPRSQL